ncbi:nuclear pore complex protein Nup153 [Phymastichus coffea]|uniref:nuclear pore complex protein Nup153 n=1 Tax=Phymastichus coffea TaxID=108790 RepID=UPI00273C55BF|nr:nuclear pore complex protein Nup153 [Phymastichus coffea]
MAKDNETDELSTPSSSKRTAAHRAKPYDANNSFIKKVATKMTDIIPQRSWISKWFNSSQDEPDLQESEVDNTQYDEYEETQSQPPPVKRPCIRMDVTHPPGTFTIQPRNRNATNEVETSKDHFSNHNETTQEILEPFATGRRLDRFVASTPAFSMDATKAAEARSSLNMMMAEQNNNAATNGVDDNSESSESTSGCSSLIPQNNRQEAPPNSSYNTLFGNKRRYVNDKFSFANHLQSPRSLLLDSSHRETLASRRPSFNPSIMNNTVLNKSTSLLSPFYPGNTTFGGANAANLYRSSSALTDPSQFQSKALHRASVEVNPSNKSSTTDMSGLSHTARRILETLEHFSSPLSDAKKMPVRNIMGGNSSFHASPTSSRKRSREDDTASPKVGLRHLTRELTVPTVPDMLRIRRKQKLQNSTVNARKIAAARTAPIASPPVQQEYHIRTEADVEPVRNNQLKANKKTNLEEQETVEVVNLPTIPLPISSLPRFDISLPQATKPATPDKPQQQPMFQLQSNDDSFKFASPIRLAETNKNLESINNFTFSKPITPSRISDFSSSDSEELSKTLSIDSTDMFNATGSSFPNFIWTGPSQTTLKPKEKVKDKKEIIEIIKVATELKQGSVMDFFRKQAELKSTPAETTPVSESPDLWECNDCLIKNSSKDTNCVACKSAKPSGDSSSDIEVLEICSDDDDIIIVEPTSSNQEAEPKSKPQTSTFNKSSNVETTPKLSISNSIAEELKTDSPAPLSKIVEAAKNTWECPCCIVRNAYSVTTCPCCNTAQPGSINVSPKAVVETTLSATTSSGFGDKFKKPEGSWTCETCMVQNKSDITKCIACETPKPGDKVAAAAVKATSGFGDMFKKPEGSWTCDSCMIQNKSDVTKCAACETPKPDVSTSKAKPSFGNMFKKPEGSWTCDSCMVSNKSDATNCIACESAKPGTEKPTSNLQFKVDMPANVGSFKFGIDKADAANETLPKTNGFNFGGSASLQVPSDGFSFGAPKDSTGFAFKPSESVAAAATFQFGAKPIETTSTGKEENKTIPTAIFSFGASPNGNTSATTGFVFGTRTTTTAFGSTTAEKKDDKANTSVTSTNVGFSFNASTANSTSNTKESPGEANTKLASETSTSTFVFGTPKSTTDISSKETSKLVATSNVTVTPKSTLPFGAATSTEPKPAASPALFIFGGAAAAAASTSATTSTSSPSLFTFTPTQKTSEASTINKTPLPTFGSPGAPAKPSFSFGTPTETTPVQQNEMKSGLELGGATPNFRGSTNQATPSLFGNMTATSSSSSLGTAEKKPLLFGTAENKITSNFGDPSAKMSAFGSATDNKSTTSAFPLATTTPTFGTPTSVTNPAAVVSSFGSTGNMFGSPATSSFGSTVATGIFSATTKANETPAATPGIFSFGASSQTATTVTGGFDFSAGSNASVTSDQQKTGLFSFGASSSTVPVGNGFGSSGTFGAAASSSTTSTPAANFTFNAPKPDVSSFGAATPTPMFNAPSAQPAGAPPAYPGTASVASGTGGFNFGNINMPTSFNFSSTPAPAASGFNFNAPSTLGSLPAFDPNATPTFNFTANSAPPTFSAPGACASTAPGSRKIKKAVRRMPRQ